VSSAEWPNAFVSDELKAAVVGVQPAAVSREVGSRGRADQRFEHPVPGLWRFRVDSALAPMR